MSFSSSPRPRPPALPAAPVDNSHESTLKGGLLLHSQRPALLPWWLDRSPVGGTRHSSQGFARRHPPNFTALFQSAPRPPRGVRQNWGSHSQGAAAKPHFILFWAGLVVQGALFCFTAPAARFSNGELCFRATTARCHFASLNMSTRWGRIAFLFPIQNE